MQGATGPLMSWLDSVVEQAGQPSSQGRSRNSAYTVGVAFFGGRR